MAIIAKLTDGRVLAKVTGIRIGHAEKVSIPVPDISTIEEIISVNVVNDSLTDMRSSAINANTKTIDITFEGIAMYGPQVKGTTGNITFDVIVLGF